MSNSWERVDIYYNLLEVQLLLENVNLQPTDSYNIQKKRPKTSATTIFKVATTPDATILEYYQSIYTHCKQRFNIPDGIEVVKKSVYQYIKNRINNYLFGNYNISEVRSNLYNNLLYYSQLGTEDLNSETLATYFHELNFNIIKYCEETYPVQSQYSIDFELETETSNKGKNKLKQYSKTTPNTPTLPKTTAIHLQTPEQGTSLKFPLTITPFPASLAQAQTPNSLLNRFARPEDFTLLRSPIRQQESLQTSSNLLDFLAENQSKHSETVVNEENEPEISKEESIDSENKEDEITTYITKIPEFNGEDIETSSQEWLNQFENLAAPFNDWNTFKAAFLEQFTDNNTSITLRNCFQNIKQKPSESVMTYIRKFNKLLRQIRQFKTNDYYSDAQILDQFIAGLKDKLIKKIRPHVPKDLNSAIQHTKRYEMAMEEANRTKLPVPQPIQQQYQQPPTQHYQVPARRLITQNQLTPQNRYQVELQHNNKTLSILPLARIAENANLSDIFLFEFEANESPFLFSNTAANEQKAIMTMYTEAEVKGKTIRLILNSGSTGSIITYQLIQQLKKNINRPAQTVIVTADSMKKTPVGEIDNFPFTLDGITIPVKVLVMDVPQYQALVGNDWLQKANANLNWETQELTISYQGQHAQVPATCGTFNKCSEKALAFEFEPEEKKPLIKTFMALGSTSNWADKTEQEHFTLHSKPKTSE
ncbi:hypothetical protein G9A89_021347 [Geosiphon pyriformis]|nr:hypothetical protein G9A89_021347 [Geosiphon pyriformis]